MAQEKKKGWLHLLRMGGGTCPHCACRAYVPSRRWGPLDIQLAKYGFRAVKCEKCQFPYYRWSWKPLISPNPEEQGMARTAVPKLPVWVLPALLLVVLLVTGVSLGRRNAQLRHEVAQQQYAMDVGLAVARAEASLAAMEAANRGFLLTGRSAFRTPFNAERDRFSENYARLRELMESRPADLEKLTQVKRKLTLWFELYNPILISYRKNGLESGDLDTLADCDSLRVEILQLLGDLRRAPLELTH